MNLQRFIETLREAGLEVDSQGILDALWLAHLKKTLSLHSVLTHPLSEKEAKPQLIPSSPPPVQSPRSPQIKPSSIPPSSGRGDDIPTDAKRIPSVSVFARGQPNATDQVVKASPVAIPAGHALPGGLALTRALRPFRRRWDSRGQQEIDEQGTAEAAAQFGYLCPVFRPRQERWFDVDIVLEADSAVELWKDVLRDFQQLLRDTGAFRNVRRLALRMPPSGGGSNKVRQNPYLETPAGGRKSVQAVAGSGVRKLIFFATHGSSKHWLDGTYIRVLTRWAPTASLVLLHLLSEQRWKDTRLGEPQGFCRAQKAGVVATSLILEPFWWTLALKDQTHPMLGLPVVTLNAVTLGKWALMQMARGVRSPVFLFDIKAAERAPRAGEERILQPSPRDFERAVATLRETSADAFRLAVYLSAGAFTIPVARLVQELQFGVDADQADLAEVLLSGLVFAHSPSNSLVDANGRYYECYPEAKEILLRSLRRSDADAIAGALRNHLSRYITKIYGRAVTFQALVPDQEGKFDLPEWAQPFAKLRASLVDKRQPRSSLEDKISTRLSSMPKLVRGAVAARAVWRLLTSGLIIDRLVTPYVANCAEFAELTFTRSSPQVESLPFDERFSEREEPTKSPSLAHCCALLARAAARLSADITPADVRKEIRLCAEVLRSASRSHLIERKWAKTWLKQLLADLLKAESSVVPSLNFVGDANAPEGAFIMFDPLVKGEDEKGTKPFPPTPVRWVLVAGLGKLELSPELKIISEAVGYALAVAGFGLITGGWPGVDESVTNGFISRVRQWNVDLKEWLLQIVEPERRPRKNIGNIIRTTTGEDAFQESAKRADAVVLINGNWGTTYTAQVALDHKVPVIPLVATSGGATKIYHQLLEGDLAWPSGIKMPNWELLSLSGVSAVTSLPNELRNLFALLPLKVGEFARAPKRILDLENVDLLQDVVLPAVQELRGELRASNFSESHITYSGFERLPLLLVDKQALKQVVLSLLSNSIKYARNSSSDFRVQIDIRQEMKPHDTRSIIELRVSDWGIGISDEYSESLFQAASSEAIPSQDPLHVGLFIAREIVKAHHGDLEVVRRRNPTVFKVWFPSNRSQIKMRTRNNPPTTRNANAAAVRRSLVIITSERRLITTGFVLNRPRVIISSIQENLPKQYSSPVPPSRVVTLIDYQGQAHSVKRLGQIRTHTFGPLVLSVPKTLKTLGLTARKSPLKIGEEIMIIDRDVIKRGRVEGLEVEARIEPFGLVNHLAILGLKVTPGSSGTPVLDASGNACGFIVGISDKRVICYPSEYWVTAVSELALAKSKSLSSEEISKRSSDNSRSK